MSWRFKDFLLDVKGLDEAAFLARHPYPLLLSEGQVSNGASGRVTGADAPTRKVGTVEELAAYAAAAESDDAWVLPIRRKETSRLTIITVGRGEECDVRIVHPLVSKKHAYFQETEAGFCLADAASTNCTFVDGDKLEPHTPRPLTDSLLLRFGPAIKYRWFGPRAFFAYCSMRARMKEEPTRSHHAVKRPG